MSKIKLTDIKIYKIIQMQAISCDSNEVLWTINGEDLQPISEQDIYSEYGE